MIHDVTIDDVGFSDHSQTLDIYVLMVSDLQVKLFSY